MKKYKLFNLLALLVIASTLISACGTASKSPAFCAYIAGDTYNDHDIKLIVYPEQTVRDLSLGEKLVNVPCNSRNFIMNDGTRQNANQQEIGDNFGVVHAVTSDRTPIKISVTAYWQLNQSDDAMRDFYVLCEKYSCGDDVNTQQINSSTPGWNSLLGENLALAMEATAMLEANKLDSSLLDDMELRKTLATNMSGSFKAMMQIPTGYKTDLFCGSGDSVWKDNNNRGPQGEFYCSPVRFFISNIELDTEKQAGNNSARLDQIEIERAKERYGANYQCYLAAIDMVKACGTNSTCVFDLSNVCSEGTSSDGLPIIVAPGNPPTPTVEPTVTVAP